MITLNLSDRLPIVSLGDSTVPQEGELSLSQWIQWSQGLPIVDVEAQLMAIVHPTAGPGDSDDPTDDRSGGTDGPSRVASFKKHRKPQWVNCPCEDYDLPNYQCPNCD